MPSHRDELDAKKKKSIEEFKEHMKKKYGTPISYEQAEDGLNRLAEYFQILHKIRMDLEEKGITLDMLEDPFPN